jgi:pimeloyl-ACP methyl ester carboxylesterase
MDVILVPGLWLDASSWEDITPALEAAGHTPHPLTMPGTGEPAARSADVGIGDWVAAVVAELDALPGPAVLVGHSGGGNVVWGAADARPDKVARVVFVDTVPPPPDQGIWEFEPVDGVIPFPGWDSFEDEEVGDLDDATRAKWSERVHSVPVKVPTDPLHLTNPRRHDVPVTIMSGQLTAESFPETIKRWGPFNDEYTAIRDSEVVHLDSGHWPQFSKPEVLARELVAAIR